MTDTVLHYIGGSATKGASTRVMDVYNPALGEKKSEERWAEVAAARSGSRVHGLWSVV